MYLHIGRRERWSKRSVIDGMLGAILLAFAAAGCPGSVDPSLLPSGTGGNTGGGGGGGTTPQMCDPTPIFAMKVCANAGCHDAMGTSAAFDMASADWQAHLVGGNPKGGGALASKCAANGPYLAPAMLPAKGLFLDKLKDGPTSPCGVVMPQVGTKLSSDEFNCVQLWANALVAAGGTAAAAADGNDEDPGGASGGGAP